MRVTRFKINNYKSIGTEDNYLLVEPNVTALIGKNESGKSNILEAIGKLSFLKPMDANYIQNKNRGTFGEVSIIVEMEFDKNELKKHSINHSKTILSFTNTESIEIEGGLSDLIKNDSWLMNSIDEIVEFKNDKSIWGNDRERLKLVSNYLNELSNVTSQIYIEHIPKLNNLKRWIVIDRVDKEELSKKIDIICKKLECHYGLLPQIYYREKDRQLDTYYKYDDIKNIINDPEHIFNRFLLTAEITNEEIMKAWEEPRGGYRRTIRNTIEEKVKKNIQDKFNDFYRQEKVTLEIEFDNQIFAIYVSTDNKVMSLSERSNGLRWYLSLFIDILSRNYEDTSVLYLLDEPGVYLHVNAQKELLELFSNLTEKKNQVIYTTHSPYMINNRNILNIRAIEKDKNGNTKIFKNAYNQNLSKESKMETLSPLVKAIGADFKFNIGPSSENNIITEGITDYMYMKAMLDYLKIDNPPNIIPSVGAGNINRIVSILIGWGCDFVVLLDYDSAGYAEYKVLVGKLDDTLKNKIVFVNCISEIDEKKIKVSPETIESLIIEADFEKLSNPYDGTETKKLTAQEFYDKVTNKEIELERETVLNFEKLFKALKIIKT